MRRWVFAVLAAIAMSVTARAHFVFVVPDAGSLAAQVLLSETLEPDPQVDVALIAGTTLVLRDAAGRERPLTLATSEHRFVVSLKPGDRGVVHGLTDLGVMTTGTKPHLLQYHPKTIIGDPFDGRMTVGGSAPVEIVPTGEPGAVRLRLIARGRPQAGMEVTVIAPDGSQRIVNTDGEGRTEILTAQGRYGAWARFWEPTPGARDGKSYAEVRHYATLVFDTRQTGSSTAAAGSTGAGVTAARMATLPEPTSSFGAVAVDGWLYVYGGHIAPTHSYATEAVSGRFSRLNLSDGKTWERLPDGPPLQGMNLATHGGLIYRIGGMQPRNKAGEPQDLRSVADVARFDPARGRWEPLPPLPTPRSSHDVVVIGDTLTVVGGWNLMGKAGTEWPDSMDVLDLAAPSLAWRSVPQPFKRRALVAAAHDAKLYVLGGFDEQSRVVHGTSIYDPIRGTWSAGPDLPGGAMNGFGPAAADAGGQLFVSIDDGSLHRLDTKRWVQVGRTTPRIVHRLAHHGGRVLVLGGAIGGQNLDLVEAIQVDR